MNYTNPYLCMNQYIFEKAVLSNKGMSVTVYS